VPGGVLDLAATVVATVVFVVAAVVSHFVLCKFVHKINLSWVLIVFRCLPNQILIQSHYHMLLVVAVVFVAMSLVVWAHS